MANLQEVKAAIDQLSPEDLREVREHLEKRAVEILTQVHLSPEERIRRLDETAKAIRGDFTEAEWETVEQAINEDYIEPGDESE